jgi:hypothetical protein
MGDSSIGEAEDALIRSSIISGANVGYGKRSVIKQTDN